MALYQGQQLPLKPVRATKAERQTTINKQILKEGPISSLGTTNMSAKSAIDDSEEQILLAYGKSPADAYSELLAQTIVWFEELAGGSRWNYSRDGKAFDSLRNENQFIPAGFILFGICAAVEKSPAHKLGCFKYCVDVIRDYSEGMRDYSVDDVMTLAKRERLKVLRCRKLNKWKVSEMTKEEFTELMHDARREEIA